MFLAENKIGYSTGNKKLKKTQLSAKCFLVITCNLNQMFLAGKKNRV
jgi:hypothetical protein